MKKSPCTQVASFYRAATEVLLRETPDGIVHSAEVLRTSGNEIISCRVCVGNRLGLEERHLRVSVTCSNEVNVELRLNGDTSTTATDILSQIYALATSCLGGAIDRFEVK